MKHSIVQFGGILPKTADPFLLPEGKSQDAVNCRFDHGGVEPLLNDLFVNDPTKAGTLLSIFLYQYVGKFLTWITDVKALTAPLANDAYHRVFYTESGKLKVTDSTRYCDGGTDYPEKWIYPSPPAPSNALVAVSQTMGSLNQIFTVSSITGSVKITSLAVTGIALISPLSLLKITGTGIAALDGKSFSFRDVVDNPSAPAGTIKEYITLDDITSLGTGNIQSVTKAANGIFQSVLHGLHTNDTISISAIGMVELNTPAVQNVTVIDANHFTVGINTTAYSTFTGGTWTLKGRMFIDALNPVYPIVTLTAVGGDTFSRQTHAACNT